MPHEGRRLPRVSWGTSAPFPLADLEKTAAVPGFDIYASARYRDYTRESFYGVGAGSSVSDRTDYGLQDGLYEGIVRFRVARLVVHVPRRAAADLRRPGGRLRIPGHRDLHRRGHGPGPDPLA